MYYIEMIVVMNLENSNEKLCTEKKTFVMLQRESHMVFVRYDFYSTSWVFFSPRQCSEI